jgi:hypothetical protein
MRRLITLCALTLVVGSCATIPDRQPDAVPVLTEQSTRLCDPRTGICVHCTTYPIRNLDGSLSHYREFCR